MRNGKTFSLLPLAVIAAAVVAAPAVAQGAADQDKATSTAKRGKRSVSALSKALARERSFRRALEARVEKLEKSRGVAGPQGPAGPQGAQGLSGTHGTNGTNGKDGHDGTWSGEPIFQVARSNEQPISGTYPKGRAMSTCPANTTAITGWGSTNGIGASNASSLNLMMVDKRYPTKFQVEAWGVYPGLSSVKSVAVCVDSSLVKWL